jgi:hypothetical protein
MRLIFSLLAVLLATSVNAAPSKIAPLSKPSVADQIRHPRGQQVAGNCQTTFNGSAAGSSATRIATDPGR